MSLFDFRDWNGLSLEFALGVGGLDFEACGVLSGQCAGDDVAIFQGDDDGFKAIRDFFTWPNNGLEQVGSIFGRDDVGEFGTDNAFAHLTFVATEAFGLGFFAEDFSATFGVTTEEGDSPFCEIIVSR